MKKTDFSVIEKYIDDNKEYLFKTLSALIQINTANDRKNAHESRVASFMKEEFSKFGVGADLYTPDSVEGILSHADFRAGKDFTGRENLTASINGRCGKRSLMLAGHSDTVPIGDLSLWTVDPFGGIEKDGKIWGRGACDDKYALATMLFLAKILYENKIELNSNLHLTAYVDEEFGGGNGALAAALAYPCNFYLNLDCKNLDIWNTAAGGQRVILNLRHPSLQHSCHLMMEGLFAVKREVDKFGERRVRELKENPRFDGSIIPETAIRYMNMGTGLNTNDRHKGVFDFAFYTDKTRDEIWRELEELFDSIREKIAPLGLEIESVVESSRFFTYGFVESEDANVQLLRQTGESITGKSINVFPSCLSDLSLFLSAAPGRAVSFGAGRDFDVPGGAHLPDEFIECESLLNFAKIVTKFVLEWDERDF